MLQSYQASSLKLLASQPDLKLHSSIIAEKLGMDALRILDNLESEGFVTFSPYTGFFMIQPSGLNALAEYNASQEEIHRQRSEEERKQNLQNALEDKRWRKDARRSWVQWAITTILTVTSFFAGAIVEVLTGFMQWIIALFH